MNLGIGRLSIKTQFVSVRGNEYTLVDLICVISKQMSNSPINLFVLYKGNLVPLIPNIILLSYVIILSCCCLWLRSKQNSELSQKRGLNGC